MFKKFVILFSFLAYSLTLIHNLVPHHHHDEAKNDHHHHGNKTSHHHHDHDNEKDEKGVTHAFADAVHHPGSGIIILSQGLETVQKKVSYVAAICFDKHTELLSAALKPPEDNPDNRQSHYSSVHFSFLPLRAPPVA